MTTAAPGQIRPGIRQGPLTWAQSMIWQGYLATPPERRHGHTVVQALDVPPGVTPAAVSAALDALVARHEALRTTCHARPDGPAQQVVHPPRPVPVEQIAAPDAAAAAELAEQARARLKQHGFDLADPDGIRAALVLAGAEPATVLVAVHHIAVDGWSWGVLRAEFEAVALAHTRGRAAELPPVEWQPLDQAAYEQSGPGRRVNSAALRYWERQYGVLPDRVLPSPGPDGGSGGRTAALESSALVPAMAWLSARHKVTDATLMMAAFAAVLAAVTGREQSSVMTLCSNRVGHRTRDLVGCLAQYTVVHLDLRGGPSFAELVERANAAMLTAFRHGQYDYGEMKACERACADRRGLRFSQPAGLNFRRYQERAAAPASPGPAPVLSRADTRTSILPRADTCARGVVLLGVKPSPESVLVELLCDAAAMTPDQMTALVQALEAVLIGGVTDPGLRLADLPELASLRLVPGADWVLTGNCWVNLRDLERALLECPGVRAACACLPGEGLLTAYVACGDDGQQRPTPELLRRAVLAAAGRGLAVIAPDRYVVCERAPADAGNLAAWPAQPAGPGRTP